jgi:hypothetical protein
MGRLSWMGITPLLCACVSTQSVVRSRFAEERRCPEDQVVVDEEGGTQYWARGCDKEATYVCGAVAAFRAGFSASRKGFPIRQAIASPTVRSFRRPTRRFLRRSER